MDEDFGFDEPVKRPAPKLNLWDMLTVLVVLATLAVIVFFGYIFLNPNSPVNPLQPHFPTPFVPPTATITPIQMEATWTPTVLLGTNTPTLAPTITLQPSNTPISLVPPTRTPTLPPPTRTPKAPYSVTVSAIESTIIHPDQACNWTGIGGTVVDASGAPTLNGGLVVNPDCTGEAWFQAPDFVPGAVLKSMFVLTDAGKEGFAHPLSLGVRFHGLMGLVRQDYDKTLSLAVAGLSCHYPPYPRLADSPWPDAAARWRGLPKWLCDSNRGSIQIVNFKRFRFFHKDPEHEEPNLDDDPNLDPNNPFPDAVEIPFQDVLDLHSIPPNVASQSQVRGTFRQASSGARPQIAATDG